MTRPYRQVRVNGYPGWIGEVVEPGEQQSGVRWIKTDASNICVGRVQYVPNKWFEKPGAETQKSGTRETRPGGQSRPILRKRSMPPSEPDRPRLKVWRPVRTSSLDE